MHVSVKLGLVSLRLGGVAIALAVAAGSLGCGATEKPVDLSCSTADPKACCNINIEYECMGNAGGPICGIHPALKGPSESAYRKCVDAPNCGVLLGYPGCPCDTVIPPPSARVPIDAIPAPHPTAPWAGVLAVVFGHLQHRTLSPCQVLSSYSRKDCCGSPDAGECGTELPPDHTAVWLREEGIGLSEGIAPGHTWPKALRQEIANGRLVYLATRVEGTPPGTNLHHFLVVGYSPGDRFTIVDQAGYREVPFAELGVVEADLMHLAIPRVCKY